MSEVDEGMEKGEMKCEERIFSMSEIIERE